jgi:nucleoside-diphosphate-sugar epimerase
LPARAPGRHLCVDLVDPGVDALLHDVLGDADLVFHLAARPGVRGTGPDIELVRRRDNVDATRIVLACTRGDVPVVVTSSSSVYGGARTVDGIPRPSHEADPLHPFGGYACSKVAVEQLCADRAEAGGVVTVVRPFSVVGECQRSDMAITRWLRAAVAGEPLQILGSPDRSRDFTDVADVVRALVALGVRGETTTVNVGTGRSHTLSEVVRAIGDAVGGELAIEVVPAGTEEPHATRAHTGRCERVCGFVPETDVADVVHRQLDQVVVRAA